jgi:hypothetical protein
MMNKRVLLVGIDPELVDFTDPTLPPGLNAAKVRAALQADVARMTTLGFRVTECYTDLGDTAAAVVAEALRTNTYDCVLVGGGARIPPANLLLFEKLINTIHEGAPRSKICFNTNPADSAEAVQRWI